MLKWAFNPDLRPEVGVPIPVVKITADKSEDVLDNTKKTKKKKNKKVLRSNTSRMPSMGRLGVSSLFGSFNGINDLTGRR